jgi:hypothetical protein
MQCAEPEPLEPWMEELYRRVSDNQTMGSVVDELRSTLGEAEKALDQFFRNPQEKARCSTVPGHLAQMRGVLSVLGLDQASLAVLRMRDTRRASWSPGRLTQTSPAAFEKLGNNLGASGFLIDMLNYQRALAKKLFVYDEDAGELRPAKPPPLYRPMTRAPRQPPCTTWRLPCSPRPPSPLPPTAHSPISRKTTCVTSSWKKRAKSCKTGWLPWRRWRRTPPALANSRPCAALSTRSRAARAWWA